MTPPEEMKAEYSSSLADLTFNSKPLINVLTILAEENLPNARVIVEAIEEHLSKVSTDVKLPILYLIDCIVKNVGQRYTNLFSQNIVSTFSSVFEVVDEKTRSEMFKLRQTWNDVFPQMKLYAIDVQINRIDPAWPVTAQPNSIHVNPKFFKGTQNTSVKPKTSPDVPTSLVQKPTGDIDRETLLMQEQLIQKQKELLELQRKTLELEVLQTQVKLQEQMKAGAPPVSTNILLKPEVAKQLIPEALSKNRPSGVANVLMNQRMQNNTNQPRISSVNPSLASGKPIRDPRILRQQKIMQKQISSGGELCATSLSSQKTLDNNKLITSKHGVRDIHKDPRLSNKTDTKSKTTPVSHQPSNSELGKNNDTQKSDIVTYTNSGKSEADKSPNKSNSSSSGSLSSSSLSSLDSPNKSKSRSPNKHRKREKSDGQESSTSKRGKLSKTENNAFNKNSHESTTFNSVKNSTKNRNYIQRNVSPVQQQDEDLRPLSSSSTKEREQGDLKSSDQSSVTESQKPMDVDLRQFGGNLAKKRSSTDPLEQPNKKSKSFDMLFGNEDTDLRQLAGANTDCKTQDRPPTPPPPIISAKETESSFSPHSTKRNDLDAIRAKLANATSREKVLSKSFHKKKLQNEPLGDLDLRPNQQSPSSMKNKIMISPEEEKVIKSGHMTKEQEKQFLNKIFIQIEKDKLKEAQQKDNEESLNISLQPISDEEFSLDDDETNGEVPDVDDRHVSTRQAAQFNDKDERYNLNQVSIVDDVGLNHPTQFYPRDGRRPPFRPPNWRGRGRGGLPAAPQPRPPLRPWMPQHKWRNVGAPHWSPDFNQMSAEDESSRSPGQDYASQEFTVNQDDNKTLSIDGVPRDIRIYNDNAVIFMNWDDPREISFQNGLRHVIFNNKDSYVLAFGEGYKECLINGYSFRVKLGVPSREIFINDVGFECFFGGAPINITVNGINLNVQLEGPPPQVKIGDVKRTDLVVGKITLIINAKIIVPVFLDAKVQKFVIDGETSTLRFVDSLKRVLINDVPFNVEFGGLPKPFTINGKKHFIRFSVLPKGVKPGLVKILDMEGEHGTSPRREESSQVTMIDSSKMDESVTANPALSKPIGGLDSPDNRSNSPSFFNNILQPGLNNLDAISNVLSTFTPAPSSGSYQVEIPGIGDAEKPKEARTPQPAPVNVNELFQKLVASGLFTTKTTPENTEPNGNTKQIEPPPNRLQHIPRRPVEPAAKPQKKSLTDVLKLVSFGKPETLKIRQASLYTFLYTGMQCSSCGMRFPPEASMLYSQHLDWHFRQNRKGKKNARVASSRRWYYSLTDWKNYEEIEDLEEREKSYFDQQQQAEVTEEGETDSEIPTVPADPGRTDEQCKVCRDAFDQFFNEEKEEWHLKNAIKVDDNTYHPVCYEDYNKSILENTLDDSKVEEPLPTQNTLIPGLEIILDDDDDEDENLADAEVSNEVVSLPESDESKPAEDDKNKEGSHSEESVDEDDDDDVILNEVAPIKIVVDDDDDDDDSSALFADPSQPPGMKNEKIDDDGFVDLGQGFVSLNRVGKIKIKSEPIDEDDIASTPLDTSAVSDVSDNVENQSIPDVEPVVPQAEHITSHAQMLTSMDGNADLSGAPVTQMSLTTGSKIKINITKSLPVISPKESSSEHSANSDPEVSINNNDSVLSEPEILSFKPALKDVQLKKLPRVCKGNELTGLCSIM